MADSDVAVAPGARVGVVGAGTMGAGIAEVAARSGHPVALLDSAPGAVEAAVQSIGSRLARDVAKGRLSAAEATAVRDRVAGVDRVEGLRGCSVAVEAVAERLDVKRALFRELEGVVGDHALLATNTSSLSVTAVAAGLHHPERVVGLHFFNPAPRMRLVEVVRGDGTAPDVVDAAVELARAWGKTPVVAASTPGFIVNRVARPFYGEAQRMVEEGVADPATVDVVLREAGGFPMGPFELTDVVGQDVNLAVSRSVWEQTFADPRYAPTVFQQRLVDAGRLGRKTGRGVYRYAEGRAVDAEPRTEPPREAPAEVELVGDPEGVFDQMLPFLGRIRAGGVRVREVEWDPDSDLTTGVRLPGGAVLDTTMGYTAFASGGPDEATVLLDWAHDPARCTRVALMPSASCPTEAVHAAVALCQAAGAAVSVIGDSPGGIVARTVAMLVNEAVELVGRREATAEDVDVAMLLGTGYPSGPLEWGDRIGGSVVGHVVEALHDAYPSGRYRASLRFGELAWSDRLLREL